MTTGSSSSLGRPGAPPSGTGRQSVVAGPWPWRALLTWPRRWRGSQRTWLYDRHHKGVPGAYFCCLPSSSWWQKALSGFGESPCGGPHLEKDSQLAHTDLSLKTVRTCQHVAARQTPPRVADTAPDISVPPGATAAVSGSRVALPRGTGTPDLGSGPTGGNHSLCPQTLEGSHQGTGALG